MVRLVANKGDAALPPIESQKWSLIRGIQKGENFFGLWTELSCQVVLVLVQDIPVRNRCGPFIAPKALFRRVGFRILDFFGVVSWSDHQTCRHVLWILALNCEGLRDFWKWNLLDLLEYHSFPVVPLAENVSGRADSSLESWKNAKFAIFPFSPSFRSSLRGSWMVREPSLCQSQKERQKFSCAAR